MMAEKVFATSAEDVRLHGALDGVIDASHGYPCQPEDRFRRWNALPESAWLDYRCAYVTAWNSLSARIAARERWARCGG